MTDYRELIKEAEARLEAATPRPWSVTDLRKVSDGNRDCLWVDAQGPTVYRTVAEMTEDAGLNVIWGLPDAEFIAHAPETIAALIVALRSVLDEQDAAKEKAWDEGFDAAEKDIMDHDANRWENECVPNPYRRALTGGER